MRLKYKGYIIQLIPLKMTDGSWQLEIESGEVVHTHTISKNKTLGEIENFAFDKIDEYVKEEEKR
jgi:hypothetical protein